MGNGKSNIGQPALEKEVARVANFLEMVPRKLRVEAAWRIICEAALTSTDSMFEAVGLLEDAKLMLREKCFEVAAEEEEDPFGGEPGLFPEEEI